MEFSDEIINQYVRRKLTLEEALEMQRTVNENPLLKQRVEAAQKEVDEKIRENFMARVYAIQRQMEYQREHPDKKDPNYQDLM